MFRGGQLVRTGGRITKSFSLHLSATLYFGEQNPPMLLTIPPLFVSYAPRFNSILKF